MLKSLHDNCSILQHYIVFKENFTLRFLFIPTKNSDTKWKRVSVITIFKSFHIPSRAIETFLMTTKHFFWKFKKSIEQLAFIQLLKIGSVPLIFTIRFRAFHRSAEQGNGPQCQANDFAALTRPKRCFVWNIAGTIKVFVFLSFPEFMDISEN